MPKDFLNNNGYKLTHNYKVKEKCNSENVISDGFFEFDSVLVKEERDGHLLGPSTLVVYGSLLYKGCYDDDNYDMNLRIDLSVETSIIFRNNTPKITIKDWKSIEQQLSQYFSIYHKDRFRELLQDYLVAEIINANIMKSLIGYNLKDGYNPQKLVDYCGVTQECPDSVVDTCFRLHTSELEERNDVIQDFFNIITEKHELIFPWLHNLLCIERRDIYVIYNQIYSDVSYNYSGSTLPLVSIYSSKSYVSAMRFANCFFQFFEINFLKPSSISRFYSVNMDRIRPFEDIVPFFNDIPILVFSSTGINRTRARKFFKNTQIKVPVFIASKPLQFEEIIDFDVADANIDYKKTDELSRHRDILDSVLSDFISWRCTLDLDLLGNLIYQDKGLLNRIRFAIYEDVNSTKAHFYVCYLIC